MNLFDFNLTLPITDPTWVFFLVLIIILFAPMILGRLHIPHIIGMILAGVLIGEHGFHGSTVTAVSNSSAKWDYIISCSLPDSKWIWRTLRKTGRKVLCSAGSPF